MSFLLDFGIVAILALFVYSGIKRGIVYMAINTGGSLLAISFAPFISSMLSLTFYNSFVKSAIINMAESATKDIDTANITQKAEEIMNALSNFTLNVFSFTGITSERLAVELQTNYQDIPSMIEGLVRPTAIRMVSTVMTFLVFLMLMFLVSFLARKLTRAIDRTKLTIPNKVLGGVVGVVEALLVIMVLALIIYFVMMFLPPENCQAMRDSIDHTWFYKYIDQLSLPNKIISLLSMK